MDTAKIFFSDPPVKGERLNIRALGFREEMRPGVCNRPTGTGDYLMMYFYDPVVAWDRENYELREPGFLYIWEPGDMQYYGNRERNYLHTWIHCDGTFVRKILANNHIPLREPVYGVDAGRMERFISDMFDEVTQYGRADRQIAENLMENWVRRIGRDLMDKASAGQVPERFIRLGSYLESGFNQSISLEEMAERVHLSVPHFCAEFKKYFGTSAVDYLIRQRLNHAIYLLNDVNLSITEIAGKVGYDDLFYFSRLFKKHMGLSPKAMRKKLTGADGA